MQAENTDPHRTAYAVTVDYKQGEHQTTPNHAIILKIVRLWSHCADFPRQAQALVSALTTERSQQEN